VPAAQSALGWAPSTSPLRSSPVFSLFRHLAFSLFRKASVEVPYRKLQISLARVERFLQLLEVAPFAVRQVVELHKF